MAEFEFDTVQKEVTSHTIDDDTVVFVINMLKKYVSVQFNMKINYSDGTFHIQQKFLMLRDDDFIPALDALFPDEPWEKPRDIFKQNILNLLKTNADKIG